MSEASRIGSSAAGEEPGLGRGCLFRAVELEGESQEVKQQRQTHARDSMSQ